MSQKHYTYSLPEQFLKDQSVPARWRVWAVINGFFVGGKTCWASNEWLGEQIGAHKDTASQAVKELEGMGMLTCKRTARTRLISPVDPMVGDNADLRSVPTPTSDRHQRLPTSDSISDRENNDATAPIVEVVEKAKPDKGYQEVFKVFSTRKQGWMVHAPQIKAAKRLLEDRGLDQIKKAMEFYREHKDEPYMVEIHTPFDLEAKWPRLLKKKETYGG